MDPDSVFAVSYAVAPVFAVSYALASKSEDDVFLRLSLGSLLIKSFTQAVQKPLFARSKKSSRPIRI
jgi:hypothetical protein